MLLHDVTNVISDQLTGETKDRYLRLLKHGDHFNDSIQIVSVGASDGIVYICIGGLVDSVSASISFSGEDPYEILLDRAINEIVDAYSNAFTARFEHRPLNL